MNNKSFILFSALILLFSFSSFAQIRKYQTEKNPGVAFALATVLPGAGQMYNDQVYLGLGVFASEAAFYGLAIQSYSKYYKSSGITINKSYQQMSQALIAVGLIEHLASMVYATLYAKKWNSDKGFYESQASNIDIKYSGTGFGFAYNFNRNK